VTRGGMEWDTPADARSRSRDLKVPHKGTARPERFSNCEKSLTVFAVQMHALGRPRSIVILNVLFGGRVSNAFSIVQ
jgi:hypothetical protein